MKRIQGQPAFVMIETEERRFEDINPIPMKEDSAVWEDVRVSVVPEGKGISVYLQADRAKVTFLRLRFPHSFPDGCLFLGDAWERGYGDLEWRGLVPARIMPWYFLAHYAGETTGGGVRVRPGAFVSFQVDGKGITLIADVRNGGCGVNLGGRKLKVCEFVSEHYIGLSAFSAAKRFCRLMCDDGILPAEPVYGGNNWYYTYGDSSQDQILQDARYIAALSEGAEGSAPYMVVDDGWQVRHRLGQYNGGPWDRGNEKFPDMAGLAAGIREAGCRPGIWLRPLSVEEDSVPTDWLLRHRNGEGTLDPSVPETLEYIAGMFRRIADWGYTLIKHDFTTVDIFGLWGKEMTPSVTRGDFHFADRTKTSAEIVTNLYRTILMASNADIMGCNCVGHLGAGLMHLQRVGDDTSGIYWDRVRQMGVNSLAFRLPQHNVFFAVDGDCVGLTDKIDFEKNRQWLDLLSRSGTPLFVSVCPGTLGPEEYRQVAEALRRNSLQREQMEPLDWFDTVSPCRFLVDGEIYQYDWYTVDGKENFGYHEQ